MEKKNKTETNEQKKEQPQCSNSGSIEFAPVWDAIMPVLNKRRPYEPDDFKPETFIPDICLAAPLAVGAAMKLMPMIQYMLTQGKCL